MQEEEKSPEENIPSKTPSGKISPANGNSSLGEQTAVTDAVLEEQIMSSFLPDEDAGTLSERKESAAAAAMRMRQEREDRGQKEEQAKRLSLLAKIQRLDVGERAKLARGGDKECRSILIKDSNKQVAMSVLANPKITVQEIELIAASRNIGEDILREIGGNKDWCKSYSVILSLVNNPKTPIPISLTHLSKLFTRDLRFLAKSKGVPEVIRTTAKRQADKRKF